MSEQSAGGRRIWAILFRHNRSGLVQTGHPFLSNKSLKGSQSSCPLASLSLIERSRSACLRHSQEGPPSYASIARTPSASPRTSPRHDLKPRAFPTAGALRSTGSEFSTLRWDPSSQFQRVAWASSKKPRPVHILTTGQTQIAAFGTTIETTRPVGSQSRSIVAPNALASPRSRRLPNPAAPPSDGSGPPVSCQTRCA